MDFNTSFDFASLDFIDFSMFQDLQGFPQTGFYSGDEQLRDMDTGMPPMMLGTTEDLGFFPISSPVPAFMGPETVVGLLPTTVSTEPVVTVSLAEIQQTPLADMLHEPVHVGDNSDRPPTELPYQMVTLDNGDEVYQLSCPKAGCGHTFTAQVLKNARSNFRRHWHASHVGAWWRCKFCQKTAQRSDNLRMCCSMSSHKHREKIVRPPLQRSKVRKPRKPRKNSRNPAGV